jgi:hypothetical protein
MSRATSPPLLPPMLRYSNTTKAFESEVPTAIGRGTLIVCV